MTTAVLFGDIEAALIDWLDDHLTPRSFTRVPPNTQDALPFVVVQRLGGPTTTVVTEQATVTIEAFSKTDKAAHDLCQLARKAIHEIPGETVGGLVFYRVQEFAGPARLPLPDSNIPRFVFTVALTVRGITT